ncbi:unnamed protein product [Phytophthora lilii]|uniref:Unnamed protein product n=1 Tax=Phytophthora lilii TaxID=2077276 RepID=A0A9W6X1C1_9STRA|nr:unnamed protein product [Phytophthora lilii]
MDEPSAESLAILSTHPGVSAQDPTTMGSSGGLIQAQVRVCSGVMYHQCHFEVDGPASPTIIPVTMASPHSVLPDVQLAVEDLSNMNIVDTLFSLQESVDTISMAEGDQGDIGSHEGSSSENEASPSSASSRPYDAGKHKWYRARRKNRLLSLRQQEQSLLEELNQLKELKAREKAEFDASRSSTFFLMKKRSGLYSGKSACKQ